jgi:hypothetical protein
MELLLKRIDGEDELSERRLVIDHDTTIQIGRASKTEQKQLIPAISNGWIRNPVISRNHAILTLEPSGVVSVMTPCFCRLILTVSPSRNQLSSSSRTRSPRMAPLLTARTSRITNILWRAETRFVLVLRLCVVKVSLLNPEPPSSSKPRSPY